MNLPILTLSVALEEDVVEARRKARQLALLLGLDTSDATQVATAVSEVARNSQMYAGGGRIEFTAQLRDGQALVVRVSDSGRGISNLDEIRKGEAPAGFGLAAARRLMDAFDIKSSSAGTTVTLTKNLPAKAASLTASTLQQIVLKLSQEPQSVLEEMRQQNHELLAALGQLQQREEELKILNRELEETNRGVVALSTELEERAERLRRAHELKTKFLSYASHEFRTPLNAIVGLARLLLDGTGRDPEEVKQLAYIQRSAEDLRELVNDLLDLAKVEAGKLEVHLSTFTTGELFGALRGMFRPLLANEAVDLVFVSEQVPALYTDEAKVSQILRNLISNALKFTERGEVRVAAVYDDSADCVRFAVSDTGIGIPPEHLDRIFEEFSQVDTPVQRRVKGTGLGLPLCRRLVDLLGGQLCVESTVGKGSTFTATVRRDCRERSERGDIRTILLIEDEEIARYLMRHHLQGEHHMVEASNGEEGLALASQVHPDVILLDLNMPGMRGWEVLERLKSNPETSRIPVIVVTGMKLDAVDMEYLQRQAAGIVKKEDLASSHGLRLRFEPSVTVTVMGGAAREAS